MTEPHAPDPGAVAVTGSTPPLRTAPGGYLEPIRSAGAVLWRDGDGGHGREVALIHRPVRDDWGLPKGKLKNGEHLLTAAVRETTEETGQVPVLGRRLPSQRYLKDGWPKQVEWWAATPSGAVSPVVGEEVDAVEWLPIPEARNRLTYGHDRRILDSFRVGPARTVPVIVLRHALAGEKDDWDGDDLLRPLDETGRADARRLASALGVFGAARVVTSAAARCTETVLPYTTAYPVEVRVEPAFTVNSFGVGAESYDRDGARAVFTALINERRPTVVCTHGELVPDLMDAALPLLGAPVPQQPALDKGDFWVLHVCAESGVLAAIERHVVRG